MLTHTVNCYEHQAQRPGVLGLCVCAPVDRASFEYVLAGINAHQFDDPHVAAFTRAHLNQRERKLNKLARAMGNKTGQVMFAALALARSAQAPAFDNADDALGYMRDQHEAEVVGRFARDKNTQNARQTARDTAKGLRQQSAQEQYRGVDTGRLNYVDPALYNPVRIDVQAQADNYGLPTRMVRGRSESLPDADSDFAPLSAASQKYAYAAGTSGRAVLGRTRRASTPGQLETLVEKRERQAQALRGDPGAKLSSEAVRSIRASIGRA